MPRSLSVLFVAALFLGGCSAVQLAYNNADWWLARQFNQYFDLNGSQRTAVRDHLRVRMEQHRQHELEDVVTLLDGWYGAIEQGLDQATVERLMDEFGTVLETTLARSVPLVAAVMAELDDAQRRHFEQRLERVTRDYRRRHRLDEPEQRRATAREERLIERIEDWTGRLSGGQRGDLSAHLASWPDLTETWLEYRQRKQHELVALLQTRPSPEAVSAFLRDWLNLTDQPAELRTGNALMRARLGDFLVALDDTLSSGQRRQVLSRIDGYRSALAALVPEDGPRIAEAFESGMRLMD